MDFLTVFIRRPILATMVIMVLVVLGAFSYMQLGVDDMPKVDFPLVLVSTSLDGAGPEEIESEITKPIEDAVAVIGGIDNITSTSKEGISTVKVFFQLEKDPDVATQEVRDKVSAIINQFPDGTKNPIILKADPDAVPIMVIAVYGNRDPKEITELCRQQLKDDIESVDGVGQVNMLGARYREIQLIIDSDKLTKYGLSISQVQNAVCDQNTEVPGGRVTSKYNEYILRTYGRLESVEEFNEIIVADIEGTQIKIKDLGRVVDGTKEARTMSRLNGSSALTLQVVKSSDANIVEVVKRVKRKLAEMKRTVPDDIHLEIVKDASISIEDSVNDIIVHLFVGGGLACLMVFIFMKNLRSTFISAIAIPSSIIATFTVMKVLNYTLNNITLLALALVVGIVIDDAIVVLENIWRLIEDEGMEPYDAAIKGTKEIGPAVIATTLSLMVLFIPVAFMSGMVGRYFQSYGITMAASIFFSMVVSFVLTPMLCSKLLTRPKENHNKGLEAAGKESFDLTKWMQDIYEGVLLWSLKYRWFILLLCAGCVVWGGYLYNHLGQEFIANEDTGEYNIVIKLPKGWPIERSSKALVPLEEDLRKMKHVRYVQTSIGSQSAGADDDEGSDISQCNIYVRLVDYDERKPYTQFQAMKDARVILKKYPLLVSSVQLTSGAGGTSGADLQFSIQGDDLDVLNDASQKIVNALKSRKGYVDVDTDLELASPELQITIDREKAASLGVDISDVSKALQTMVGGAKISNYQDGKWLYDVRLRLAEKDRLDPAAVKKLFVPAKDGSLVYLAGMADIKTGLGPSTIYHYDRQRMVTIEANLDDYPQVQAMKDAQKLKDGLNLPKSYNTAFHGSSKYVKETFLAFAMAFVLAVIFMYMVLASQFENLLDPLIILTTLPLSIPFALFSLQITGKTLNMFSALGLFLLFGIVKKNAILQIDHTNNLIRHGFSHKDAIIKANRERLRPILMTTLTLVVGMLPVALAGPTGATRAPMAIVVVGGQSLCLILTLLLVPVALSYVYDFEEYREKSRKKKAQNEEAVASDKGVAAAEPEKSGKSHVARPDDSKKDQKTEGNRPDRDSENNDSGQGG